MHEFIIEYWIEFLFGLIISGMGVFLRHYYKLYKNEQKNVENKMLETVQTLITNANQTVLTKIEENQE